MSGPHKETYELVNFFGGKASLITRMHFKQPNKNSSKKYFDSKKTFWKNIFS